MVRPSKAVFLVAIGFIVALFGTAPKAKAQTVMVRTVKDIPYATVDGKTLGLDLYLPARTTRPSLLVWVHGGAWRGGSKSSVPVGLTQGEFAVASVDFRQSTEAKFPAMVHDIKGAIRFLRANAEKYGYRADRIAIGGDSSGGHLAVLVGVTAGNAELEGTVGGNAGQSSAVQAILDYYGATNLTTILAQSTPFGLGVRKPALDLLLGAQPEDVKPLAALASPVLHVDAKDPPLLIFHGDQDPQMPINQSIELQGAYEKLNIEAAFVAVHGAAHGGQVFYTGANLERAMGFLQRTISAP